MVRFIVHSVSFCHAARAYSLLSRLARTLLECSAKKLVVFLSYNQKRVQESHSLPFLCTAVHVIISFLGFILAS